VCLHRDFTGAELPTHLPLQRSGYDQCHHGDLAQWHGYVNRSLPNAELDEFVDRIARRIASFEKRAVVETKRLVNVASLPPNTEISPEWNAFIDSVGSAPAQARIQSLLKRGLHPPGDVEYRLGYHLGQLGS
jgi:enoyl-CoA hydratase/carnithine racemase